MPKAPFFPATRIQTTVPAFTATATLEPEEQALSLQARRVEPGEAGQAEWMERTVSKSVPVQVEKEKRPVWVAKKVCQASKEEGAQATAASVESAGVVVPGAGTPREMGVAAEQRSLARGEKAVMVKSPKEPRTPATRTRKLPVDGGV